MTGPGASLAYPFRPGWGRIWAVGVPLAFVCVVGAIPLLGYAVRAARNLAGGSPRLPPWRLDARLLLDGCLLLAALAMVAVPFAAAAWFASGAVELLLPGRGTILGRLYALLAAGAPLGLLWALATLVLVPPGLARYCRSGRTADLFDLPGAVRLVRRGFWSWNIASVPIVTAWAIALLALFAGVVGAPIAAFYAILVSAHASSTLVEAG